MKRIVSFSFLVLFGGFACGANDDVFGQGGPSTGAATTTSTTSTTTDSVGGASTGGGGTSSGNGGASTGGDGSGAATVCGDGTIDNGEECDDGDEDSDDGCTNCVVDCPVDDKTKKDPASFHCYRFFDEKKKWDEAHDACLALGEGWDLAAPSTIVERDFVVTVITEPVTTWIGANDRDNEGAFVWSNGEPFSYNPGPPFWENNQPNNFVNQDCVLLNDDGTANDDNCGGNERYACEHTPLGTPASP